MHMKMLLGKGRAKKGLFEGDLDEGELEIGQVVSSINNIQTVKDVMNGLICDYNTALNNTKTTPDF